MAVHFASFPRWVIVNTAGAVSDAVFGDLSGLPPFVQVTEIVTDAAGALGAKSFRTISVAGE